MLGELPKALSSITKQLCLCVSEEEQLLWDFTVWSQFQNRLCAKAPVSQKFQPVAK